MYFRNLLITQLVKLKTTKMLADGYIFKNFARESDRQGGGTGILYRNSFDVESLFPTQN